MTTISKSNKLVTLINVFTVKPANQQQLVDLLARATETSVVKIRLKSGESVAYYFDISQFYGKF